MNRKERRKQGKSAPRPKTYVLTEDQIEKIKHDAVDEATYKAFLMFLSIPVMVLHDKFGFGKFRLGKLMDYCLIWYEAVLKDEVRLMELVKIAENECGIKTLTWGGNQ
jgi:hypothetical protein